MLNENSTAREIEQQNVNTKFHMDRPVSYTHLTLPTILLV